MVVSRNTRSVVAPKDSFRTPVRAVGAHHDHVAAAFAGHPQDLRSWLAGGNDEGGLHRARRSVRERVGDEAGEALARCSRERRHAHAELGDLGQKRVAHRHDNELGAEVLGDGRRIAQGTPRGRCRNERRQRTEALRVMRSPFVATSV